MVLEGEKVVLRPLERGDLDRSRAWVNDPRNAAVLLRVLPVSELEEERWFESLCHDPSRMVWAVVQAGRHVGNAGLYHIDLINRRAELWILIGDTGARGQGLGEEAVSLLLDYGFKGLGLNKIYLHVASDNRPAVKLYRKLGFALEGELVQDCYINGRFVNVLRMYKLCGE